MKREERIRIFTEEIWRWFASHKRDLPWRDLPVGGDMERAYRILVSEIMLQQTQVSRVKIVYKDFLIRFPNIDHLSSAKNAEVLLAWRGMGYNSRALRLRDAARTIMTEYGGIFPSDMESLMALPGLGHYTAAAIRNFAFNIPTPCLDTNIRRILHRTFVGPENPDGSWKKDDVYLLKLAEEILHVALGTYEHTFVRLFVCSKERNNEETNKRSYGAAEWHAALMDFGSLVCTKRNPRWDICPLTKAGIMKAAYRTPSPSPNPKKEPGRMVGSKFVPNRIFRGKIIEELRDASQGLPPSEIGRRVCIDWKSAEHSVWLQAVIATLKRDHLIEVRGGKVRLAD